LRVDPTKAESCFRIFTATRSVDIETAFNTVGVIQWIQTIPGNNRERLYKGFRPDEMEYQYNRANRCRIAELAKVRAVPRKFERWQSC
jgi:hypothetical protein